MYRHSYNAIYYTYNYITAHGLSITNVAF